MVARRESCVTNVARSVSDPSTTQDPSASFVGQESLSWLVSAGVGTLYSRADIVRSPSPEFAALVPYTMALVDLDEG